jgi:hypothetical protein
MPSTVRNYVPLSKKKLNKFDMIPIIRCIPVHEMVWLVRVVQVVEC